MKYVPNHMESAGLTTQPLFAERGWERKITFLFANYCLKNLRTLFLFYFFFYSYLFIFFTRHLDPWWYARVFRFVFFGNPSLILFSGHKILIYGTVCPKFSRLMTLKFIIIIIIIIRDLPFGFCVSILSKKKKMLS